MKLDFKWKKTFSSPIKSATLIESFKEANETKEAPSKKSKIDQESILSVTKKPESISMRRSKSPLIKRKHKQSSTPSPRRSRKRSTRRSESSKSSSSSSHSSSSPDRRKKREISKRSCRSISRFFYFIFG